MTQRTQLRPAMCRRDLLPQHLLKDMERLLSHPGAKNLSALNLAIYNAGDSLFLMAGMSYFFCKPVQRHHTKPTDTEALGGAQPLAADLALRMTENQNIAMDVEHVDADFSVFPNVGTYLLLFFPGCAILSVDDPLGRLMAESDEISHAPNIMANRAPYCSIILNKTQSQHQRVKQPDQVFSAMMHWRNITNMHQAAESSDILIIDPTVEEIIQCENDHIGKDTP